jgi:hypothetical protein
MATHQVEAPYASETELTADLTNLGAPVVGPCNNCGARAVADGEDGCPGS